ncbi:MAG: helix-turn-helix transcriptional regulator [Bryobacterales bacterium]|nr:helix-turn-helix transcriptional regulator [Bryobacterales bacterium]
MNVTKKARLENAGWAVGSPAEFLQLTQEEQRFIEVKLALATGVKQWREQQGMTQAGLAKRLGSSQSRIAKLEAADPSVSLDLLMRSLLTVGATPSDIAKLIQRAGRGRAA